MNDTQALVRIEPSPLESSMVPASSEIAQSPQEFRASEINALMMSAYLKAGTLAMTPDETAKLTAEFPRSCIEKRENRFIYIPHIHISKRLTDVFGPGQWTMIRRREWIVGNQINAEWVMIIRGHFIGESIGSQEYYPDNKRQNFADVLEATRGECIRRIAGKYLGCGGEAWDPAVAREMDAAKTREMFNRGQNNAAADRAVAASSNFQAPRNAETPTAGAPSSDSNSVKALKEATAATRDWMLSKLADIHPRFLAWSIDKGILMPDQSLDEFPLARVARSKSELEALRKEIEEHV